MKYWCVCVPRRGQTLKTLCWVNEATHKRPRIVWFHLHEVSRIHKSIDTENRLVVSKDREWLINGFPFWVMKMFQNEVEVISIQHGEGIKCHWIIHLKMVNFMLCEFYLNYKTKQISLDQYFPSFHHMHNHHRSFSHIPTTYSIT